MKLTIKICHSADAFSVGQVVGVIDCDTGPFALPKHIRIGGKTWDGKRIENYDMQVDEYGVWLEDQVQAGNTEVMEALEEVFTKAQGVGVILATRCCPQPYITHAHHVQQLVEKLANGLEPEDEHQQS